MEDKKPVKVYVVWSIEEELINIEAVFENLALAKDYTKKLCIIKGFEFQGEDEAQSFNIPDWFGKEITETMLAKDSDLLKLSESEFNELINSSRIS